MITHTAPTNSTAASSLNGTEDHGPLCAAHTPNFPALLRQLGASLDHDKLLESSFVVPTECLGEVAATVRASANAD
jgi:hypothetical protein